MKRVHSPLVLRPRLPTPPAAPRGFVAPSPPEPQPSLIYLIFHGSKNYLDASTLLDGIELETEAYTPREDLDSVTKDGYLMVHMMDIYAYRYLKMDNLGCENIGPLAMWREPR